MRSLGADVASPLGPYDAERVIAGAEFHDALDEFPPDPDLLLLTPSAGGTSPDGFAKLAERAARARVGALALKCRDGDTAALGAVAEASGVAIIRVSERVSWRLFDALVAPLLGAEHHPEDTHRDRGAEPLFALANELAGHFGGSVAIEDLGRRILAYSSIPGQLIDSVRTQGILTRRVPDSPFNDDQYRTVLRADHPLVYPGQDDEAPRIAMGVRAGTLPLGTIWVITADPAPELSPEQDARVRAAAAVAAAHMLDDVRARKASQIPREARFRTLLDGTDVAGSELAELGITEERGAIVLAFEAAGDPGPVPIAQLRSTVHRHLALRHPEAVTVIRDRRVYALLARGAAQDPAELVAPLIPLVDRLIGPGSRAAIPGTAHRSGDVAELRQLAERLLDAAARAGAALPDRILGLPALRPRLALERFAGAFAAEPALRAPEVDRLCAEEPSYAETLLAWCGHFGNVARTARALQVHENTVRHRIRQAEEQYGVRLTTPDERLTAWVQLRVQLAGDSLRADEE
ncbi:PucR family transcriptional regulator [Leucobacter luti]|uniref:DNA-binding PucR family transcriptional regulator n=1 Tax=Leucobacter luti TaxID=340320 RepID=A0A4Q7TSP2_9MICO|nr:PucR family transcriptional regulator [Leucobacter luti]MBL3699945.1 PucR family transcriptional regulator [Leucobacter luti]RZT62738.1 DNA-binding PucR family transcriptional regulator [Leucobacter luti]